MDNFSVDQVLKSNQLVEILLCQAYRTRKTIRKIIDGKNILTNYKYTGYSLLTRLLACEMWKTRAFLTAKNSNS